MRLRIVRRWVTVSKTELAVIITLTVGLGVLFNIANQSPDGKPPVEYVVAFVGILSTIFIAWFSQEYLAIAAKSLADKDDKKSANVSPEDEFENEELIAIKEQVQRLQSLVTEVDQNQIEEIAAELRESVVRGAASDLIEDLKRKVADDYDGRQIRIRLRNSFDTLEERLNSEVVMLRFRSNLNMIIGIVIAFLGITVLAVSLFLTSHSETNYQELVIQMTPRFSVVILIEVFAYFFLRMYRQTLAEIRYFQNEITNIQLKKISAYLALHSDSIEEVLKDFSLTERNGVMKSEHTTQEIEKLKLESNMYKNTLTTVASLFAKHNK